MLREMILVPSDSFPLADGKTGKSKQQHPKIPIAETTSLSNTKQEKKKKQSRKLHLKKKQQQRPYDKRARFRERIGESNFKREALIKEFARFLRKVLPKGKSHEHVIPKMDVVSEQTLIKQTSSPTPLDVPDTKEDAVYGEMARPFLFSPNTRMFHAQYGIRKDGDNLKISNSIVTVDNWSNITIRGKQFEGTADLWNY
jgi:hypothetical protein